MSHSDFPTLTESALDHHCSPSSSSSSHSSQLSSERSDPDSPASVAASSSDLLEPILHSIISIHSFDVLTNCVNGLFVPAAYECSVINCFASSTGIVFLQHGHSKKSPSSRGALCGALLVSSSTIGVGTLYNLGSFPVICMTASRYFSMALRPESRTSCSMHITCFPLIVAGNFLCVHPRNVCSSFLFPFGSSKLRFFSNAFHASPMCLEGPDRRMSST